MTETSIPASLRRRVLAEARGQCAYCHSLTAITGAKSVIDHIVPDAAGGPTEFQNLCLACHACNAFKHARLEAQDPVTGEAVPLFHPRRQRWNDHLRWSLDGTMIVGITPTGRATVEALNMNHLLIVEARRRWVAVGWHPPVEDLGC
jgi:hypothetical protein